MSKLAHRVISFEQLIADADRVAADTSKADDVRARAVAAGAHFRKMQEELTSKNLWPKDRPATGDREAARRRRQAERAAAKK